VWMDDGCLHDHLSGERLSLRGMDADRLVQTRQLEDLTVVLREPIRQEALLLTIDADQKRDQQPDP